MTDLHSFRATTRAWLEENCPETMRQPMSEADVCWGGRKWVFQSEDQRLWLDRMATRGWTVPEWPQAYGGGGLSGDEAGILKEEMSRINARPPLQSFGIWMLGPALLEFGTEEQKRHYLPKIARGEIRWCQGYSEPGAGSDLAGLQTKGVDCGSHFEVTGQKIWTSYADQADWIFCLVRTEPDAPKHKGISFLLFDMTSAGVSTQPIQLISGASPFCETFFDQVEVPADQIVGARGNGWTIAKYLLTHEREMIGSSDAALFGSEDVVEVAKDAIGLNALSQLDDPLLRAKIADFLVDEAAFDAELARAQDWMRAGNQLGVQSATLKYTGTELNKRRQELIMEVSGLDALEWDFAQAASDEKASLWLRSKANSIEGGTSEVMLSILSKAVLELG
ncbi:acyl-CoA dehydrogenase [Shimia litoralis]|uniref:Acyl-CoA dehydrogenase n=1 Tax=Shimia litoralis TaxID=420403 RepID=A0A4U7N5G4_9RHOB|nr:acyl-CoA dehydrogenase family protein [Shimia litoralis]TKZ21030.1 acyl-CoA dehydrogenase [Shimia litoralis]